MTAAFAEHALELAVEAAGELGVDPTGAAVLRVASAVTIELPRAGVIARVEPASGLAAARRQAIAGRILGERRVPAPRLVDGEHQPLVSPVGAVTLWRRLEIVAGSPSPESIGRLARRLHTSCADDLPVETPDLDPFEPIPGWLDRPGELPLPPGADELWKSLSRLRPRWAEIVGDDPLGTVLVHGDLHADNVVLTPEGPVMLDLEMAGRGPASWDLLPQRLAVQRYGGEPEAYRRFCAGYGDALADSPAVQFLQEVYELHLVSWAVGHRDLSPAMAAEAEIRLAVYLGDSEQSWTLI